MLIGAGGEQEQSTRNASSQFHDASPDAEIPD
jgi:hypothetical protein